MILIIIVNWKLFSERYLLADPLEKYLEQCFPNILPPRPIFRTTIYRDPHSFIGQEKVVLKRKNIIYGICYVPYFLPFSNFVLIFTFQFLMIFNNFSRPTTNRLATHQFGNRWSRRRPWLEVLSRCRWADGYMEAVGRMDLYRWIDGRVNRHSGIPTEV
jgi:hypothetical protein